MRTSRVLAALRRLIRDTPSSKVSPDAYAALARLFRAPLSLVERGAPLRVALFLPLPAAPAPLADPATASEAEALRAALTGADGAPALIPPTCAADAPSWNAGSAAAGSSGGGSDATSALSLALDAASLLLCPPLGEGIAPVSRKAVHLAAGAGMIPALLALLAATAPRRAAGDAAGDALEPRARARAWLAAPLAVATLRVLAPALEVDAARDVFGDEPTLLLPLVAAARAPWSEGGSGEARGAAAGWAPPRAALASALVRVAAAALGATARLAAVFALRRAFFDSGAVPTLLEAAVAGSIAEDEVGAEDVEVGAEGAAPPAPEEGAAAPPGGPSRLALWPLRREAESVLRMLCDKSSTVGAVATPSSPLVGAAGGSALSPAAVLSSRGLGLTAAPSFRAAASAAASSASLASPSGRALDSMASIAEEIAMDLEGLTGGDFGGGGDASSAGDFRASRGSIAGGAGSAPGTPGGASPVRRPTLSVQPSTKSMAGVLSARRLSRIPSAMAGSFASGSFAERPGTQPPPTADQLRTIDGFSRALTALLSPALFRLFCPSTMELLTGGAASHAALVASLGLPGLSGGAPTALPVLRRAAPTEHVRLLWSPELTRALASVLREQLAAVDARMADERVDARLAAALQGGNGGASSAASSSTPRIPAPARPLPALWQ
jgi:hypothetical protein